MNSIDYIALNAMLTIPKDGKIQFDKDKEATRLFFTEHVNNNTRFFHDLEEKIAYLIDQGYYKHEVFSQYDWEDVKGLYKAAYAVKFRFKTYLGAFKFYSSYALKTKDGERYLERYEDRVVIYALETAQGEISYAHEIMEEVISGRLQPATPTFLSAGRKNAGEKVSCFLIQTQDNMESISHTINAALQLSKRGGGVGISLTNLRERSAPIKGMENMASGVVPVMKVLEDSFSYANQLGQRDGAGAVYLHAHHPDIMEFLDTKRENADEKIRIKTLSLGVVIPDITFELARLDEDMYLFSPYDIKRVYGKDLTEFSVTDHYYEMIDNPEIRKRKVNARKFFTTLAEIQSESGYPYILFEDTANRAHNNPGYISQSNICVEILQVQTPSVFNEDGTYKEVGRDISCNLASMNIAYAMDGRNIEKTVNVAVRALTNVSDTSNIVSVGTVANGNRLSHSIGLGQMNLHGFLGRERIHYGSEESLDFIHAYFSTIAFHAIKTSMSIAWERGITYEGFEESKYKSGEFFVKYIENDFSPKTERVKELAAKYNLDVPSPSEWAQLASLVNKYGMYNAYLLAVPPTGSISYINNATASIHPIVHPIEPRKEKKLGRVYYPAPEMTNENLEFFKTAYEIGWKPLIDVYSAVQEHTDQSLSMTLFFNSGVKTREINQAQIYAWKKNIKTIYYIRIAKENIADIDLTDSCESCVL